VAVQYRVVEGSEADSYYKLQDHVEQIKSYVLDVVRAKVPKMNLDEVFEKKDDVGAAVKSELDVSMRQYGFEIPNALVTDVNPADNVKAAMNEIQTQQRLQVAAAAKGEANKNRNIFRVKALPNSAAPSSTACASPSPLSPTKLAL
jgi:regulator of protease activity HflC (stomatin/prohibitin superfamily)